MEAARPPPAITQLRERARAASPEPILNPASREPLNIRFNNASLRDILNFIGMATGINMTYDREVVDRPATVQLDGVTVEQALNQILSTNQLSYKVLSERSILIFPDTAPKHAQYDDQVVRTFYLSNADATEMTQILSTIIRLPGIAVQPAIAGNKTSNSITVRGTAPVVGILEKIIAQNDKPRAEIVVDVEILEVNRNRAKTYGLNLSEYALGGVFSPEVSPGATTTGTTANPGNANNSTGPPSGVRSPPPFNLNTISRGFGTNDFYLAVPTAVVKFLESDTQTRLLAKPQLRGAEGTKLALKLGDQIPVISTSYTPIAGGGAAVNPLSSYQYKDVGVNIDMTPRVTLEGDIILDLVVDNSSVGQDRLVAGQLVPSFGQRTVTTRLRLRDGESNLLAGLLREDERKSLSGFPGAIHVPILKQLFSANDNSIAQTDIVMLLTPHIVRTSEITVEDLKPLYIGSQQNLGLGGAPALIAPLPAEALAAAPAAATPPPAAPATPPNAIANPLPANAPPSATPALGQTTPSGTVAVPPGSSPVPGTVLVPPEPAATPPNVSTSTGENPPNPPAPRPQPHRLLLRNRLSRPRRRSRRLESGSRRSFSLRLGPRFASARAVQRAHLNHRSAASLGDHADVDVRPGRSPRAERPRGQLHAHGRCRRLVRAAGEWRPHRHHDRAGRGHDRRVGHGPSRGGSVRRHRARKRDVDSKWCGNGSGRPGDGPAVPAHHGFGAAVREKRKRQS